MTPKKYIYIVIALGLLLHAYTATVKSEGGLTAFSFKLMIWSWVPYLICLALNFLVKPLTVFPAAILTFLLDIFNYYTVFINPKSSTAAIGLLWVPLWNIILFIPAGLLVEKIIVTVLARKQNNS
jgi:hypothetical protein